METWDLEDKVILDKSKSMNDNKMEQFLDYLQDKDYSYDETTKQIQITVSYQGVEFECEIDLVPDMIVKLKDKNNKTYLTLNLKAKTSLVMTRNMDIPLLPNKNKLETVMKLREKIVCFFHLNKTFISDSAHVMCDSVNEYNLILYRILATNKPIKEISLYHKFAYKYEGDNDEEMQKYLDEVRNMPVKSFAPIFQNRKYYSDLLTEQTVHEFFSNMCKMNSNCNNCRDMLERIHLYSKMFPKLKQLMLYCENLVQDFTC